jgi:hypothetical protein
MKSALEKSPKLALRAEEPVIAAAAEASISEKFSDINIEFKPNDIDSTILGTKISVLNSVSSEPTYREFRPRIPDKMTIYDFPPEVEDIDQEYLYNVFLGHENSPEEKKKEEMRAKIEKETYGAFAGTT